MILVPVIAWAAALPAGVLAVLCAAQAAACTGYDPPEYHHARESFAAAGFLGCAAACVLGAAGQIPGLAAVFAACATSLAGLVCIWYEIGARGGVDETRDSDNARLGAVMADLGMAVRMAIREAAQQIRARRARADLLPDELAPRRQRRTAPDLPDVLPAAAGQAGPPPPRRLPAPDGRNTPPVTTPPPHGPMPPPSAPPPPRPAPGPAPAAASDALTAVHALIMHALAGGMQGKERGFATLVELHGRLGEAIHAFAVRLSEPDQMYGEPVWGPLLQMAGLDQAASMAGAEALSMLRALAQMPMGEVAANAGVQAPHHDELNRA